MNSALFLHPSRTAALSPIATAPAPPPLVCRRGFVILITPFFTPTTSPPSIRYPMNPQCRSAPLSPPAPSTPQLTLQLLQISLLCYHPSAPVPTFDKRHDNKTNNTTYGDRFELQYYVGGNGWGGKATTDLYRRILLGPNLCLFLDEITNMTIREIIGIMKNLNSGMASTLPEVIDEDEATILIMFRGCFITEHQNIFNHRKI